MGTPAQPIAPRQVNITERTSKAEIISAACELTDSQAATIDRLLQQQTVLAVCLAVMAAWLVIS
jgi:hypothetical protein